MSAQQYFQVIPDFDNLSAKPTCYISNLPKMSKRTPQMQDHEVDEFILRGPEIEFEGYLDIRPQVIISTARDLFGMRSEDEYAALIEERNALDAKLKETEERLEVSERRLSDQILANAEQIVQHSALAEELSQAYEDLYSPEELQELIDRDPEELS